ncbi:hypothetical protein KF947_17790 [Halomonas sp. FeN2]|uniref:hypothetical protein n=1 Tax=Halomonas sp. FeN2 TaxID=2832500 RepID=UPI001D0A8BBF|nr:hypothetical protein [Halomonas sp. FeN2]UBR49174.1 hypothetical protein KF947_17790 [Halomonas sp. FeN2]
MNCCTVTKQPCPPAVGNNRHRLPTRRDLNKRHPPSSYVTEVNALGAARSEWQRIQRGLAEFELTLGRADISPETPVTAQGYKPEINATPWIIDEVTHNFTARGYTCSIRMERR